MTLLPWKRKPKVIRVQEAYDLWASSYPTERNPVRDFSNQLVTEMIPRHLKGMRVLDAGCGTGAFCKLMEERGAEYILGVDISPAMIKIARSSTTKAELLCNDLDKITLAPASFDLVVSSLVLGHVDAFERTLSHLLLALGPTGTIIITDFHPALTLKGAKRTFHDPSSGKTFEIPHHLHLLSEYLRILDHHGLFLKKLEEPVWNGLPVIFALHATRAPVK